MSNFHYSPKEVGPLSALARNIAAGIGLGVSEQPEFPADVAPWNEESTCNWPLMPFYPKTADEYKGILLPRQGLPPPAGFSYPVRTNLPFAHGVSSGDPTPDAVIIWTALTRCGDCSDAKVEWRMATDPTMTHVIKTGSGDCTGGTGWTFKVDVTGLRSYTTYYYQFFWNGAESCVGRTRTAPNASQNIDIRIAVASCASYFSGFMNGYGRIADRADLDLVIHAGDYVYNSIDSSERMRLTKDDDHEPKDITQWRRRYALYRSDPDLFRAHQQHPWIIIWDNHDTCWIDKPETHPHRVFWEWTASRTPWDPKDYDSGFPPYEDKLMYQAYRSYRYGRMADIIVLDRMTRYFHNEKQYLEEKQFKWLENELVESKDRGSQWRIVLNQALLGQLDILDPPNCCDPCCRGFCMLCTPCTVRGPCFFKCCKDRHCGTFYQAGVILEDRQWDGFPKDRIRLFKHIRKNKIRDNIVLTGDMHLNIGNNLEEDPNLCCIKPAPVGVEFAPSSISRGGGYECMTGLCGTGKCAHCCAMFVCSHCLPCCCRTCNQNIKFFEWTQHGYGIVDVNADRAIFEFWWTPINQQTKKQSLGRQMVSHHGDDHLRNVTFSSPLPTKAFASKPAPEVNHAMLHHVQDDTPGRYLGHVWGPKDRPPQRPISPVTVINVQPKKQPTPDQLQHHQQQQKYAEQQRRHPQQSQQQHAGMASTPDQQQSADEPFTITDTLMFVEMAESEEI